MAPDFIKRGDSDSTIDCGEPKVKNKFKWYWLDENDISGERIGSYIEKCKTNGEAWCVRCKSLIMYATSGKKAFTSHAKSKRHTSQTAALKVSQQLPAVYHNIKCLESGAASSSFPVFTIYLDRLIYR